MKINEFYKPKISKGVEKAAFEFFPKAKDDRRDATITLKLKLKKMGWIYLDNGAFSSVYVNDKKSYVIKINSYPDPGFEYYVNTIKKYHNKHFPKISDKKVLEFKERFGSTVKYFVYLIERLKEVPNDYWRVAYELQDVMDHYNWSLTKIFKDDIPKILMGNPSLYKAAVILGKESSAGNRSIDMHRGNIMQREDGTIVITDPYV